MSKLERHSPSSLNLFCASSAMFVLERVLGKRQPVGVPAHRGTAVEAGASIGLLDPKATIEQCTEVALRKYRELTALSPDPRREAYGEDIPSMVARTISELRPYGLPSKTQGYVEWRPEGLRFPIVGYFDFAWEQHGIIVDLKTTEKLPSKVKVAHARQVALYAMSDNLDARVTYVTPKKSATYSVESIRDHREALRRIAITVERFVSLFPDDPAQLAGIVCPDLESFYWTAPEARQIAFEQWGV
jgi:hypothetical protein